MPLARPAEDNTPPPPPFKIDRAQLAGMTAGEAHEAVLGAFDAGILSATAVAGMIDQGVIDAKVAELADARRVAAAHAPYRLVAPSDDEPAPAGVRCLAEGADTTWPCQPFRDAAAIIADGLPAVVTE